MNYLSRVFLAFAVFLALLVRPVCARAADPTTADCLSANDSSIALRNGHKLLAARAQLLICAAASCPADIRNECARRVADVNVAMPTIVFEAKDVSGKDLSEVSVTMDGQVLAARLEGTALSIDPGEHTFVFETAGQPSLTKQLVIAESQKDRRESVVFGAAAPAPTAQPAGSVTASGPAEPAAAPKRGLGTQKTVAIAAAGVGVVGVVVGAVFGAVAISKKSDAQKACPGLCMDQSGVDKWSSAKSAGTVSTVAFIVGGVGLAGGAALWFTAKPAASDDQSVRVGIGPGSLQLRGVW